MKDLLFANRLKLKDCSCSGVSLAAVFLAGMGTFWNESYQQTQWQIYLIYIGVALSLVGLPSSTVIHGLTERYTVLPLLFARNRSQDLHNSPSTCLF